MNASILKLEEDFPNQRSVELTTDRNMLRQEENNTMVRNEVRYDREAKSITFLAHIGYTTKSIRSIKAQIARRKSVTRRQRWVSATSKVAAQPLPA